MEYIFGGNPLVAFTDFGWYSVMFISLVCLMMAIVHLDVRNIEKWAE